VTDLIARPWPCGCGRVARYERNVDVNKKPTDAARKYVPHKSPLISFFKARARFLSGEDTPRAFLERCLATIEAREPTVKAFTILNTVVARAAADASTKRYKAGKPLSVVDGLPIGIKDVIETADMPMGTKNKIYRGWPKARDAAAVYSLRTGGAAIVGKTVIPDGGIGKLGPTRNPHDQLRSPGASSSGSAASVGAGMLPAALGTQAVGSLLRPASFCGCYAFKPTFGGLNRGGVISMNPSQACLGIVAGALEDIYLIAHHIADQVGGDPGSPSIDFGSKPPKARKPRRLIRLGAGWDITEDGTKIAFETFVGNLERQGVEIIRRSAGRRVRDRTR
jgi:Asp-tRNA(Asn)/Glu-tRNA(Gln) amidotransferase A subunit family amidase